MFHKAIKRFRSSGHQLPREFNFVVTFQSPYDLIVAGLPSFLLPKMPAPEKGDALSPRPTNCILRTRSHDENAGNAGFVLAAGLDARPHGAKRGGSIGAAKE